MAIVDRPVRPEPPEQETSSEAVVKQALGTVKTAGELAAEHILPPLTTVATVLDFPMNLVRGAAAGKFDEAFERMVSAREIPLLQAKDDDSTEIRVLKNMIGTGLDFVGPAVLGTGAIKGSRYVLKGMKDHKLWVERRLEDVETETVPRLHREIEARFEKLSAEDKKTYLATQQRAEARELTQIRKEKGRKPEPGERPPLQMEEAPGLTAWTKTDQAVADDLDALRTVNMEEFDALVDLHGAKLLDDWDYTLNAHERGDVFLLLNNEAHLQRAYTRSGTGMGAGLQRFKALEGQALAKDITPRMSRLLKNYSMEDVIRMAKIYKETTGKSTQSFLKPLVKPSWEQWALETYLGHILGPASSLSASLTTQGWMYLRALDVMVANSRPFRTLFGKGLEAERATMDGRALMMGYVDGAMDLIRLGGMAGLQQTRSFLEGQKLWPTKGVEALDGLSVKTAVKRQWESLNRFHADQQAKFGLRQDMVKAENLGDWVPGRENELVKGLTDLWGASNRFWPKAIAYLDTGARFQMLRGNLYRAYHRYKDTAPSLAGKTKDEAIDFIEQHPKDFLITDLETGDMVDYIRAATTMGDSATMSMPIKQASWIFRNPLFRMTVSPYADVAMRSIERVGERLPFMNKLTPQGRALAAQGGESEMLRRAGMANAAMFATTGALLHQFGYLTGSGPRDPDLIDTYELEMGAPPQSLTMGDVNFDLRRVQPFGTYFTFFADITDKIAWLPEHMQQDWWEGAIMTAAEWTYVGGETLFEHTIEASPVADIAHTYRMLQQLSVEKIPSQLMKKGARTLVDVTPILPTATLRWFENLSRPNKLARRRFDEFTDALDAELAKLGVFNRNTEVLTAFPPWLAEKSGLTHVAQHTKQLPVGVSYLGYVQATSGMWGEGAYLPSVLRRIPKTLSVEDQQKAKVVNDELVRFNIDPGQLDPTLGLTTIRLPTQDVMLLRALRGHGVKVTIGIDDQGRPTDRTLLDALHWVITNKGSGYHDLPQPLTMSQARERLADGTLAGVPEEYLHGAHRIGGPDRITYLTSIFRAFNQQLVLHPLAEEMQQRLRIHQDTVDAQAQSIQTSGGQQ
jgi:hypothetical protein